MLDRKTKYLYFALFFWPNNRYFLGKDILRRKGLYLVAEAKDKGNLLRQQYAKEFVMLIDWVANETLVTSDNIQYKYQNICLEFQNSCFSNAHARFVAEIFSKNDQVYKLLNYYFNQFIL